MVYQVIPPFPSEMANWPIVPLVAGRETFLDTSSELAMPRSVISFLVTAVTLLI